ncbi:MAG: tetratricopeptide repeat protein [Spirochaetes bacterium]|nr:tetratricopeptide repeat protein [Spirochaetota bacterium]
MKILAAACILLLPFTAMAAAGDAEAAYTSAKSAYDAKRYYAAVPVLEDLYKKNPYYAEPSILLADIYIIFENYTRAKEVLVKLGKFHPRDAGVLERLLQIDLLEARLDDAKKSIERLRAVDNKNYYSVYAEGYLAEMAGHIDTAKSLYQRSIDYAEDAIEPNTALAYLLVFSGKREAAKIYFDKLVKMHPRSELVYYHRANYHYLTGDQKQALAALEKALYYHKDFYRAKLLMADVHIKTGNYRSAISVIKSLPAETLLGEKDYRLGFLYEKIGDSVQALSLYKKYIDANPDEIFSRVAYERVLFASVKPGDARRTEAAAFYRPAAQQYLRDNDFFRAEVYYKRLLRLTPADVPARRDLANIYRNNNQTERYLEQLTIAHELAPDDRTIASIVEYRARELTALPSRQYGVEQYAVPSPGFTVAVFDIFRIVRGDHEGLEASFAELLAHTLHQFPNVRTREMYAKKYTPETMLAAIKENAVDFYIEGNILATGDRMSIDASLIDANTRRVLRVYRSSKTGKEKMIEAAYEIARAIAKDMPLFGTIVKIQENNIILNLGRRHGVSKGMRFTAYRNRYPHFDHDKRTIAALPEDIAGTIVVNTVDENISIGTVENMRDFSAVRHFQYVVPAAEAPAQAKTKKK